MTAPKSIRFVAMLALFFVVRMAEPFAAGAQVHSNISRANLTMTVGESVTIIPPSTAVPISYTSGATSTAPATFQVTTLWQLSNSRTTIHENWWFSSATAALSNGNGGNIPASQVFSNVDGGAYSGCTAAADPLVPDAVGGSTCNVGLVIPLSAANYAGQQTDTIGVELQGLSTALAAGNYTGTLSIEAGTN